MSPMERTRKVLRDAGIINGIVERYHPKNKKYPFGCKQDFLNIIDLIALDNGILGIQVCGTDWMPHYRKIMSEEKSSTVAWVSQPGARLEIWGWRRVKKVRGKKAVKWEPRIADVSMVNGELYWKERK